MATLIIRNLPDELVERLKALAQTHGRSMEEEVRQIIRAQVGDRLSALGQIRDFWKTRQRPDVSAEQLLEWESEGRR